MPERAIDAAPDGPSVPRFGYPVTLDLHGVTVLVVGGGRIGARKAAGLAGAGAAVRLVATAVSEHVRPGDVAEIRARPFDDRDLDGVRLVVTATGDRDVDAGVAAAARARGIWVNAADQPDDCDFILPAIARRGRVTFAVSTDGASPALAGALRDVVDELFADDLAGGADDLAAARAEVHGQGASTEDVDWSARVDEIIAANVRPRNLPG
jgi:precorrin-2 dehydrogenase/sirohydrochlorin ferrochelatase